MKIEIDFKSILILLILLFFSKLDMYIIFIISIIVHEFMHLLIGKLFGEKTKKIVIDLFGASLEFYEYNNIPKSSRILIFLAGPLSNFVIAICFYVIINDYKNKVILTNLILGIFNLIPIIPLDGGRILKEILSWFINEDKSFKIIMIFSKMVLVSVSFVYGIAIVKVRNVFILIILIRLWYLYLIEEKKYNIYNITKNSVKKLNI